MKKSILMIMAAAAFVSCSESATEPAGSQDSMIRLKSTALSAGASTRAPFIGAIGAGNTLTALIPSATSGDYVSDLHAEGTMTFDGSGAAAYNLSSLDVATKAQFPDANDLHLFGLYPAEDWTINATGAAFTFTGKEDVMAAAEITTNKAEVQAANDGTGSFKSLTFNHLLTKLEVKFKAAGANAASEVGYIKSVELVADAAGTGTTVKNGVTYTADGNTAVFAGTESSMPFYGFDGVDYAETAYVNQSYELTTTAEYQAYTMVAPVTGDGTASSAEYYIKVITENNTTGKVLPVDLHKADKSKFTGSTAGYSFTITVLYSVDDINVEAVVTDWLPGGETIIGGGNGQ